MFNKNVLECLIMIALISLLANCTTTDSSTTSKPTADHPTINQNQLSDTKKLISMTAQFTTRNLTTNKAWADIHWRLSRASGSVELLNLDSNTSEIWNETSNNLWFYKKVFHDDQQIIEYSPIDLNMLGVQPQWLSLALAINPTVLSAMGAGKSVKPIYGWKAEKYKGQVRGATYEIIWLPELAIAARVKCTEAGITTITEMQKPFLMPESPWQITDINNYRLLDYSDLGDMERDPFVMKIQGNILGGHDHKH